MSHNSRGDDPGRSLMPRRRSFSAQDKRRIVAECREAGATVAQVSRRLGICASLLFRWRRLIESGELDEVESARASSASVTALRHEVLVLRRELERKRAECEALTEALHQARARDQPLGAPSSDAPDEAVD
jgi:transposase